MFNFNILVLCSVYLCSKSKPSEIAESSNSKLALVLLEVPKSPKVSSRYLKCSACTYSEVPSPASSSLAAWPDLVF